MEWAVGKLYVEKDFQGESKEVTEKMIQDLFSAFRQEILDDATWMSEETKNAARDKLEKMRINVGYPDFINNEQELNAKYASFDVKGTLK